MFHGLAGVGPGGPWYRESGQGGPIIQGDWVRESLVQWNRDGAHSRYCLEMLMGDCLFNSTKAST